MIVCSCLGITDKDINAAVDWMRASDAHTLITPGKVYRALGKSADCGSCLPLFLSTMRQNANLEIPMQLRGLGRVKTQDLQDEGRRESHRLP
ncbi:(2Fe-2S)-binding protein [Ketogulonicigenium vulgare]|uniref:Bacterioferritin-associated ferredoxin n=1 Tax=Ketogulonicigenium vulgare (strain WSH-001) TaxID=759362 RepID=F9YAF1_KETVW|nr:(2Fe-2S)-binding protein [Ketogulonicigenium vulgare]ADO42116.1 probable bacterioferritin-associated ferredoxin [Ketogulonicigenium vulgare Y25]AEM40324.1 bacterioferritin-associated ferredoxin [Ketogulonicigenium vulgare WSH-001]ALJ80519.1 (2Fe-2S)-binding protein [Ketogulonicigenium vulgare]ANW34934.1 (2Fe-2S)-binding protein [Ketogulonicigenium vulgare]AOZ54036.1 bacterioferritin-associated ferredoxin [Ketogulonicigenium vulgare]